MENPEKFIEAQLRECGGYGHLLRRFEGMSKTKFVSLGLMELHELIPDDDLAVARIYVRIKELHDVQVIEVEEPPPPPVLDPELFIQLQLKKCGYENLIPCFKGVTRDKFLSLGFVDLRELVPGDESVQAKLLLWIKGLADDDDVQIIDYEEPPPPSVLDTELFGFDPARIKPEIKEEPVTVDLMPLSESQPDPVNPVMNSQTEPEPVMNIKMEIVDDIHHEIPNSKPEEVEVQLPKKRSDSAARGLLIVETIQHEGEPEVKKPRPELEIESFESLSGPSLNEDNKEDSSKASSRKDNDDDDSSGTGGEDRDEDPTTSFDHRHMSSLKIESHDADENLEMQVKVATEPEQDPSNQVDTERTPKPSPTLKSEDRSSDVNNGRVGPIRRVRILKDLCFLKEYKSKRRILTLRFDINDLNMMNEILDGLKNEPKLQHVQRLSLKSHENFVIGRKEIKKLIALPQLEKLTELELDVGLDPTTCSFIEILLRKCAQVLIFTAHYGFASSPGTEIEELVLRIPEMNKLSQFIWGSDEFEVIGVVQSSQSTLNTTVKTESKLEDSCTWQKLRKLSTVPVQLDFYFSDGDFNHLEVLELGFNVSLKVESLDRFPNLFEFGIYTYWDPIQLFSDSPKKGTKIREIQFPKRTSKARTVELVVRMCPLLTKVWMNCPNIKALRTLIRLLKGSNVTHLFLETDYLFESALITAFLDVPYVVRTPGDSEKLMRFKKYPYWKEFAKTFRIKLPKLKKDDVQDGMTLRSSEGTGIQGLKKLTSIVIEHTDKKIFMPIGEKHWTDPEFQVSSEPLGFKKYPFPCTIMRDELTKLVDLKTFETDNFKIPAEDWARFLKKMDFNEL